MNLLSMGLLSSLAQSSPIARGRNMLWDAGSNYINGGIDMYYDALLKAQDYQNQKKLQEQQNQLNLDFEKQKYINQMEGMQAAGINPMAQYSSGQAITGGSSATQINNTDKNEITGLKSIEKLLKTIAKKL